jgi:hypothetical protein
MRRRATNDERLWKQMCLSKFGGCRQPPSWRALFRFNHEFLHHVILRMATDELMQARLGGLSTGNAFNIPVLA